MVEDSLPRAVTGRHEGLLRTLKTPGQRGSGEARRANHPPSGFKEITETIGNTHEWRAFFMDLCSTGSRRE